MHVFQQLTRPAFALLQIRQQTVDARKRTPYILIESVVIDQLADGAFVGVNAVVIFWPSLTTARIL